MNGFQEAKTLEFAQNVKAPIGTGQESYRQKVYECKNCGIAFKSNKACKSRAPVYCSRGCCNEDKKGKGWGGAPIGNVPWNKGSHMWTDKRHPRGTLGMKFPNRKPITDEQRRRLSISHRGLKYPSRSGENHHWWKGGITPGNENVRKSSDYSNWRILVFDRDDFTCQDCHKKGGNLHAHHIELFSDNPNLRFDINNGITLCLNCHAKRHNTTFSTRSLNNCPDCGKRIKVGANRCRPCQKINTHANRNKCVDCGAFIQRVSIRCRSCAAKINITKTENYKMWPNFRRSNVI